MLPPRDLRLGNLVTSAPVATLWIGSDLSPYEQLSLKSFVRSGVSVAVYVYGDVAGVPDGVAIRDGRAIVPEKFVFQNPRSLSFAMFANLFRYEMINQTGDTWIDADLVKLSEPLPDRDYVFAYESPKAISNGLVRIPSGSPLILRLLEGARPMLSPDRRDVPWGTFGPRLLTESVVDLGLERFALNAKDVYPIHYVDMARLFSSSPRDVEWCRKRTSGAITLHLWNKFLQDSGQKAFFPHPSSYLGELMRSNDIELYPPFVEGRRIRIRPSISERFVRRLAGLARALIRPY